MKQYDTLTEAMESLRKMGYTADFNLHHEWIECPSLDLRLRPEEFHVDEVHRFEGVTSSPDDNAVLFVISSTKGAKGLLIDAYGAYASVVSSEMIKKLKIDARTEH